jgi:Tfp pilus tip-associated adhesin PilY1
MRWNILRWNTVIVCHNTYHSNSNSIVCCLEINFYKQIIRYLAYEDRFRLMMFNATFNNI